MNKIVNLLRYLWSILALYFNGVRKRESVKEIRAAHDRLHEVRSVKWEVKSYDCHQLCDECHLWRSYLAAKPEDLSVLTDNQKEKS